MKTTKTSRFGSIIDSFLYKQKPSASVSSHVTNSSASVMQSSLLEKQPQVSSSIQSPTRVMQSSSFITQSSTSVTQSSGFVTQSSTSVTQPSSFVTQSSTSVTQSLGHVTQSSSPITQSSSLHAVFSTYFSFCNTDFSTWFAAIRFLQFLPSRSPQFLYHSLYPL